MIIRDQQFETLERSQTSSFEKEMLQRVKEFTPRHCKVMDEAGLLAVIRRSIEKSRQYGFTNRGPVRLYTELTFMFGSDFDTDPLLPWAAEILGSGGPSNQMDRAERLHGKAREYSDVTAGPNFEFA